MRTLCLFLWLTLISLAVTPYCAADDLSEYEIVIHYREGTTIEDRIDFIRKDTKQTVNSFDIPTNNPYENLSYPIMRKNEWDYNYYDLRNVNKDELLAKYLPQISEDRKENYRFYGAGSSHIVYSPEGKALTHTAVCYKFGIVKPGGRVAAARSTIYVFNAKGEVIWTLDDAPSWYRDLVVTDDGHYFAAHYGGPMDESLEPVTPEGVRIYDIKSGRQILDKKLEKGFSVVLGIKGPVLIHDMIMFEFDDWNRVKLFFCEFKKRIVYIKEYPRDLYFNYSRNHTPDGIFFNIPGEGQRLDKFENDFEKEAF